MDAARPLFPRALASAIREALADTPVVCLLGPRQSGKTTLAQQLAPGRTFVSLDEPSYYRAATEDPAGLVASLPEAATLDEVQRAPALLPVIKHAVDRDRRPGRFLLTGSANLLLTPAVTESLAGRMEIVQLHPLTESEKSDGPAGSWTRCWPARSNQASGPAKQPRGGRWRKGWLPAAIPNRLPERRGARGNGTDSTCAASSSATCGTWRGCGT